jgi:hypothetical protein
MGLILGLLSVGFVVSVFDLLSRKFGIVDYFLEIIGFEFVAAGC